MKKFIPYLLILIIDSTACKYPELEKKEVPIWGLGTITPAQSYRAFNTCCLTYTLKNYAPSLDPQVSSPYQQTKLLTDSFLVWSTILEPYFTTLYVSPESHADVVFQFVNPAESPFVPDTLPKGWLSKTVESLVSRTDQPDGTILLSLNASHYWTIEQLYHVYLYEIGAVMGLAASDDPGSMMYPFMGQFATVDLDITSSAPMRELYRNANCDEWQVLESYPFSGNEPFLTTVLNEKGYLLGTVSNQLWEFDPDQKPQWIPKNALPSATELVSFFALNQKLIGMGASSLWEYDPQADAWLKKSDILPFKIVNRSYGMPARAANDFNFENGYYFFVEKVGTNTMIKTWKLDPTTYQWTEKKSYNLGGSANPANILFSTYQMGAALIQLTDQPLTLIYNSYSDTWIIGPAFPDFGSEPTGRLAWAMRERTYMLTPNANMWNFAFGRWQALRKAPFGTADILFHFSLKCRGYTGTSKNNFWLYIP